MCVVVRDRSNFKVLMSDVFLMDVPNPQQRKIQESILDEKESSGF